MPVKRKAASPKDSSTATIGFEAKLWLAADKLRNNMDAADWSGATKSLPKESPEGERGGAHQYKHVVLGLIFLKYISDTAGKCRMANSEIRTRNARLIRHSKFNIRNFPWSHLQANAKQPTLGMSIFKVRVPNRSRSISIFETRSSKFA